LAAAERPSAVRALVAGYRAREFSPVEVVDDLLATVERWEPVVNAFTAICADQARDSARRAGRRFLRGEPVRPLEGVPFVAKDLLDTKGLPTECGSRILHGRVPSRDAAAVARMRGAGAVLLGKTATHEFGWGITTTSGHGPATRNPWDTDRVAGGSSGGSAVAVAIGAATLALGTDTAGSIRIPAGFCGVAGLRPSAHTVPRDGAFPLAPSLDTVGPLARDPEDLLVALGVLGRLPATGHDRRARLGGVRVGLSSDLHAEPLDRDRQHSLTQTAALVSELGAEVRELELPALRASLEALSTIVLAEGGFTHRRLRLWPARREEYGRDVRARLELSQGVALDEYLAAMDARSRIVDAFAAAFEHVDVLLGPASSRGPGRLDLDPGDPAFRRAVMGCTAPQSLAGLPACVLPAGFDSAGLPIGVQLTGPPGADGPVLAIASEIFRRIEAISSTLLPMLPRLDPA
jgi:aspartyl-tRNA(Asn)/glutamyl-tRNA(Gln) amidotransferase subunit A